MSIGPVDIEFVLKGNVEGQLKRVSNTIKGESREMSQQMVRLQQQTTGLQSSFGKLGSAVKGMLPVASFGAIAIALRKIAVDAAQFSRDFSKAMREVQTISGAVKENFKGISDEIMNIAASSPDNAIQLAKAYYQIVSAGHDGAKGLELLRIASQAATAGVTDTKTAADGLTTILNAWGKDAGEARTVADAMFTTVRLGKTTFGELSQSIAQVAPMAATMKVPFEQILSAVASLTVQGVPTAQAMTQIRSSLVNLNKVLGDGWSELYTYQDALQKVFDMAGGSQNKLKKLIPDIEGINAVLGLTGEKAAKAAGHLNEYATATGAMKTAYDEMMKEADNQWSQVHNKWNRELKNIGDLLTKGSLDIAKKLNELLTDNEADIIAPGAADAIANFTTELGKMGDKESQLKLIVDKILEIKAATQKLREEEEILRKERPSYLERNNERIWGAFGLPMRGRENKVLVELKVNDIAINDRILNELQKKYGEVLQGTFKDVATTVNKLAEEEIPAVESLQKQLGDLNEKILTAGEAEKKVIAEQIVLIQQKITLQTNAANEAIKAARNALYGIAEFNPQKIKPQGATVKDNVYGTIIETAKQATLEFDKLNRKIDEGKKKAAGFKVEFDSEQQTEKLEKQKKLYADIAYGVATITNELGKQGIISDASAQAINDTMAAISTGDPIAMMGQAVSMIISMFPQSAAAKYAEQIENINQALRDQQRLIDQSGRKGGEGNRRSEELLILEERKAALEAQLVAAIKKKDDKVFAVGPVYEERKKKVKELTQEIEDNKNAIEDAEQALQDFLSGGVTQNTIADVIAMGFEDGKTSVDDFASYMNDVLLDAVLQIFKAEILGVQVDGLSAYIGEALQDKILTADEVQTLTHRFGMH